MVSRRRWRSLTSFGNYPLLSAETEGVAAVIFTERDLDKELDGRGLRTEKCIPIINKKALLCHYSNQTLPFIRRLDWPCRLHRKSMPSWRRLIRRAANSMTPCWSWTSIQSRPRTASALAR